MSEFNVSCPHCGQSYRMSEEKLAATGGRTVKCKNCQQTFTLPSPEAASPEPAAVAPGPMSQPPQSPQWQPPPNVQPQVQYPQPPPGGEALYGQGAPLNYAPANPSQLSWGNILAFRAMVTPAIIQIIFWIAAAFLVLGGLAMIIVAFTARRFSFGLLMAGIGYIIVGPLVVRIYCEILIVIFRIYDTLKEIKESLRR